MMDIDLTSIAVRSIVVMRPVLVRIKPCSKGATMKNVILRFLDDDLLVAGTALGLFSLIYFIEAVIR
jgi:hypothetical protein